MPNQFLILPNQLFEKKYIPKYQKKAYNIILWECPWYFSNKKYKFNKKKLLLHKSSMEYYKDYLSKSHNVVYVTYDKNIKTFISKEYTMFDPIDDTKLLNLPYNPIIIESPNFLLTKDIYQDYRNKYKTFLFHIFYKYGKKIIDVIPNVDSTDKENRKTLTKKELVDLKIPDVPKLGTDVKYIKKSVDYINNNFKDNYGDTENFMFPVTHATAKKWLTYFIKYKFKKFGAYQDFINKDHEFMYHSLLSTSINIGLLNPTDILDIIERHKTHIPINSYEGYVRQLFWREYQRYTYIHFYTVDDNRELNYFNTTRKLNKHWYNGTLDIPPVDDCIINGFKTGYLPHINRLMIVGNFMNLNEIHPQEGFKWFMEFACDSYDWVMCQNIYGMAFFSDGGKTMRRPYISSSNYILKMSNYPKSDKNNWSAKWDLLYSNFVKDKSLKLKKYRYFIKGL
jgi:deoxyribodipyrimidine photolyase-related protein